MCSRLDHNVEDGRLVCYYFGPHHLQQLGVTRACLGLFVCCTSFATYLSETAADLSMLMFCAILALALAASSVSAKAQRKAPPKKRSSRKAKPSGTKLCASRLPTLYHQRAAPLGTEGGDA